MKVAICAPSHGAAFRRHERCLRDLLRSEPSWDLLPLPGCPNADVARNVLTERALEEKADVLLWLDADMTFSVETAREIVQRSATTGHMIGCLYTSKILGGEPQACFLKQEVIHCYENGGHYEVAAIGFGVVAVPAPMLLVMAEKLGLPWQRIGKKEYRPWFSADPRWPTMHSDDYCFCRRVREAGFKIFVDTRHRVGHCGEHVFHLEDMVRKLPPEISEERLAAILAGEEAMPSELPELVSAYRTVHSEVLPNFALTGNDSPGIPEGIK